MRIIAGGVDPGFFENHIRAAGVLAPGYNGSAA